MEYRSLPLTCDCGGSPKQISGVGFSAAHELVVHWRCPRCHRNVCTVKPLSDCWRECFVVAPVDPTIEVGSAADRKFLHSLGVKYSDE